MTVDSFEKRDLKRRGFEGFLSIGKLRENRLGQVPKSRGVYVVLREKKSRPTFLKKSPAGHFKGSNPTVEVSKLRDKWIEEAHTIYLGKASNLRTRIGQLLSFGAGKRAAHKGGRYLWQIKNSSEFKIAWKITIGGEGALEEKLKQEFKGHHNGRLPFANLI